MIITIKNLQQQTFLMEVDPEKTVVQLKEQIYIERGEEYPVEKQNLIYAGIILEDEKTIASYNIRSNKFLVVMIKRDLGLSPSHPDEGGVAKKIDEKQNTPMDISSSTKSSDADPSTSSASGAAGGGTNEATGGGGGGGGGGGDAAAIDTEMKNIEKVRTENSASSSASTTSKDGIKQESSASTSVTSAGAAATASTGSSSSSSAVGCEIKREASDASNKENDLSDIEQRQSTSAASTSTSTSSSSSAAAAVAMSATTRSAESVLLMGEAYNSVVNAMMEMGYSKEMVERALQASFNNPERAVEYLISGIPEEAAEAGLNAAEAAVAAEVGDVLVPDAADADADVSDDPLEFLRSQPQFVQMRALIQQNPDLLNAVLQQIGLTNPALLQLITENQESFLNMLNEPIEGPNPLDPAFFVSIADRHRRSQPGGADNDHNSSDGELNVVQNRNAVGETNRRSVGDGSVDGIRMDDRIPQNANQAIDDAATAANAGGPGDRLRARAAGFAAALNLGGQNQQQHHHSGGRSGGGDSPMNALGPIMNADGNGGFVDHGRERNASQNQHGRNNAAVNRSGVGGGGSSAGGGHLPTIRLTPQDQAAIERLTALGFPEALVVQAYFACDKNETLAANFLLNNILDD